MEQHDFLRLLVRCLEALGIRYFVTDSVASMAYGEPRLTNDIDIVVDLKAEHIPLFAKYFPDPEFYLSEEAAKGAVRHRGQFNIIHPYSGLKADIILQKGDPFDSIRFQRARRIRPLEDLEAEFSSPEDVIVKKMAFYREGGSDKHLRDISGILKVSGATLEGRHVDEWAGLFGLTDIWEKLKAQNNFKVGSDVPASPEPAAGKKVPPRRRPPTRRPPRGK